MTRQLVSMRVGRAYTGDTILDDVLIRITGGYIAAVEPYTRNRLDRSTLRSDHLMAVPGFIDLQINGAGGRSFVDDPSSATLQSISDALASAGTTNFLPAVITGPDHVMVKASRAVEEYRKDGGSRVLGIHFEGPEISKQQLGIHSERYVRTDVDWPRILPRECVRLVTLAPEVVAADEISRLRKLGVLVSIGHTNATYLEARSAIDDGALLATHLFNGFRPLKAREPGAVGACLDENRVRVAVIADGVHCHPSILRAVFQLKSGGRSFIVSDGMAPVGTQMDSFQIGGEEMVVSGGACWRKADGMLAGGAVDLAAGVRMCVQRVGHPLAEALRMASLYPAQVIGYSAELGRLREGYRACITLVDENLMVRGAISDGYLLRMSDDGLPMPGTAV